MVYIGAVEITRKYFEQGWPYVAVYMLLLLEHGYLLDPMTKWILCLMHGTSRIQAYIHPTFISIALVNNSTSAGY